MTITINPQDLLAFIQTQAQLITLIQTHQALLAQFGFSGNSTVGTNTIVGTNNKVVNKSTPLALHISPGRVDPLTGFSGPPDSFWPKFATVGIIRSSPNATDAYYPSPTITPVDTSQPTNPLSSAQQPNNNEPTHTELTNTDASQPNNNEPNNTEPTTPSTPTISNSQP
ncbi:hypothetical protein Tco_1055855 [Tanacetum coccineum]|uniref:Uncharacterized protein n=1 Tax=Tanacetum coccineum TaxID=301880 RepID=A0ABQ5H0U5_9ASTR